MPRCKISVLSQVIQELQAELIQLFNKKPCPKQDARNLAEMIIDQVQRTLTDCSTSQVELFFSDSKNFTNYETAQKILTELNFEDERTQVDLSDCYFQFNKLE